MRRLAYTMRNLFRVSNIGTFVFFIINFLVLMEIFGGVYEGDPRGYLYLVLIYVFSILLSLTPIGQGALCLMCGAKRITRTDMRSRIMPLAAEVFEKAKRESPLMPDRINVRVIYDPEPNAYAIGTYTIGVTEGLLSLPDSQIQGIVAHEMGHLALQHTLIQTLIGSGNIFMTSIVFSLELLKAILGISTVTTAVTGRRNSFLYVIFAGLSFLFVFCWTKLLTLFLRGSSRANEYEADAFACRIGYGYELAEALDHLTMGTPRSSYLQMLESSHPDPSDRIGRLQAMGAGYSRY